MEKLNLFLVINITVFLFSGCFTDKQNNSNFIDSKALKIVTVSHRGANRLAPENTYAAAVKAIEAGVAYVEVDVRRSKDGVYYNFHDDRLERTTNGIGVFCETPSEVIDTLDAGGWFGHEFTSERIPRIFEFLQWIKGKAKVYFDMKDVNLEEFIPKIYELGMENDCFFWFSDCELAEKFCQKYPKLDLKINVSSIEALDSLQAIYDPQIIECSVDDLSKEFIHQCHKKNMKVMAYVPGNDWEGYRLVLSKDIDMINLDNPDIFENMRKNNGIFKGYKLIAHRGILEGKYNEYDPESIKATINRGYYMLEVDIRETKDGMPILNHDKTFARFYNDPRRVNEMTWEEVKKLCQVNGGRHPLSLDELAQICSGKIKLMIDIKGTPSSEFYCKVGETLDKYNLLSSAYFIDENARKYLWGKAKFSILPNEVDMIKEKFYRGENVACHYFLFAEGARLNSSIIKMCQKGYIAVVPSVNFQHYYFENARRGAKRDIEFLKACGVIEFQIDSDFDVWLPNR